MPRMSNEAVAEVLSDIAVACQNGVVEGTPTVALAMKISGIVTSFMEGQSDNMGDVYNHMFFHKMTD